MNSELQNCQQTEPCTVEEIRNRLDCRVLLKDHAENGFVLADLYVEDAIDIYPATVGADYTIRDYRITVSEAKVRSEMELIVLGIAEGLTFVD